MTVSSARMKEQAKSRARVRANELCENCGNGETLKYGLRIRFKDGDCSNWSDDNLFCLCLSCTSARITWQQVIEQRRVRGMDPEERKQYQDERTVAFAEETRALKARFFSSLVTDTAKWRESLIRQSVFASSGGRRTQTYDWKGAGDRLGEAIASGSIIVSVIQLPDPSGESQIPWELARGGSEAHGRLKLAAALWLRKVTDRPIYGEYSCSLGRIDVAAPDANILVECGDTECHKAMNALEAGYVFVLAPFASAYRAIRFERTK